MAHPWLVAVLALLGAWLISSVHRLFTNYQNARRSGFPVVICPINTQNPLFLILHVPLLPLAKRFLPSAIYSRYHLASYGWEFRDKHAAHDRLGPVFVLVTTGTNQLWCADPALVPTLLTRRRDFVQMPEAKIFMGVMGSNILASDGEAWARQRRLIAPSFNETISAVVWRESMTQAGAMAEYMLGQPGGVSAETVSSLRAIAMNVLGQVGYGQPQPFRPTALPRHPHAPMTYTDAISLVVEQVPVAATVPNAVLSFRYMPLLLQTLGAAMRRLPGLTTAMLDQERLRQNEQAKWMKPPITENGRENIMSMLVRMSDHAKATGTVTGDAHAGTLAGTLSEDEIAGNLFLVTGAGFDTTANTLSYAAVLLAAYPEKQKWVQEELDRVLGTVGPARGKNEDHTGEQLDYKTVYPQLVRCLSFMFETLRLYPAVMHLSRSTYVTDTPQTITAHDRTHVLAGAYNIFINNMTLHTAKSTWGDDADEFRPERWITTDDQGREAVHTPPRGTFLPWSGGPRVCPGQKMSQVEFVVVLATLLHRCEVRPVRNGGESDEQACTRLLALMEDSQPRLTLQMNRPNEAVLQWVER